MVSVGMSPSLWEGDYGWEEAAPYLPAVAYTGYYRMLQGALEDLFGIPSGPWTRSTWEELSVALARANADPNWYELVLKEKANYEGSASSISTGAPAGMTSIPGIFAQP